MESFAFTPTPRLGPTSDTFKSVKVEAISPFPLHASNFFKTLPSSLTDPGPSPKCPSSSPPLSHRLQDGSESPNTITLVSVSSPLPSLPESIDPPRRQSVVYLKRPGIPMEDWPVVQPFVLEFSKFVFNTDYLLATRQTEQSWWGTCRVAEWILSHE